MPYYHYQQSDTLDLLRPGTIIRITEVKDHYGIYLCEGSFSTPQKTSIYYLPLALIYKGRKKGAPPKQSLNGPREELFRRAQTVDDPIDYFDPWLSITNDSDRAQNTFIGKALSSKEDRMKYVLGKEWIYEFGRKKSKR